MKIVHDATVITPACDTADVRVLEEHSFTFDAGRVIELGPASSFARRVDAAEFDEVIDGRRRIVIPGLVNTHHHLYQSLTRCLPAVQNVGLFDWLLGLYEKWRHLDYEAVNLAAKVSIAELLLHGCTTTSDHFYMFPRGGNVTMEAVLDAAEELGIRIHLCRGSMTLGQSHGGLPPDDCVEDDADVLADYERTLDRFHDPSDYSRRRIDLAPCSPFNVTRELMRDTVALARERGGVLLHTHLAETRDEERFCLEKYGVRPMQYLRELDFLGPDVYLAHCVFLNDAEIELMASSGTAIAHCPTSNMRLGSGIARLRELLAAGVRVGLGVDGSSSNDGGNLLAEAKATLLVARVRDALDQSGAQQTMLQAGQAFRLATIGGAACLNRPTLGHLNPGAAADFAMFRMDDIALAGAAAQDPLAALMFCDAPRAEHVFVGGQVVVKRGNLVALDPHQLARRMNEMVAERFC